MPSEGIRCVYASRQKEIKFEILFILLWQVIQDYEAGKAIPNNALIAKFERTLGCKLPRAAK
jgi:hypothetical protein